MNLIKVHGIIIKEVQYKDNDKIVTILTDELGKVSCIARGAKKTNSPILASSQYLVYSEFVLYKNNNFYYINSATVLNMFYKLRTNLDKLELAFELTRILQSVTDENEDTSKILKLFLNTLYIIENMEKNKDLVISTFKIKLFVLLGFAPSIDKCLQCGQPLLNNQNILEIYYDYVSNIFICSNCLVSNDKRRYIKLSSSTLVAIQYVIKADIKKVFSFELKDIDNFKLFGQVFCDTMTNGI